MHVWLNFSICSCTAARTFGCDWRAPQSSASDDARTTSDGRVAYVADVHHRNAARKVQEAAPVDVEQLRRNARLPTDARARSLARSLARYLRIDGAIDENRVRQRQRLGHGGAAPREQIGGVAFGVADADDDDDDSDDDWPTTTTTTINRRHAKTCARNNRHLLKRRAKRSIACVGATVVRPKTATPFVS